jgi:hypothetical protein
VSAPERDRIFFPDDAALQALGITREELWNMDLRTLAGKALERGYRLSVGRDGVGPGLTVRFDDGKQEAGHDR